MFFSVNAIRRCVTGALAASMLAGCASAPTPPALTVTPAPSPTPAGVVRDYWPTAGWRTASPEEHGIAPARLMAADAEIRANLPDVYSLMVVRHGYIVFEQYYQGSDETATFGLRSATKSFASALIGIALRDGHLASVDQTLGELLPEYFTGTVKLDPRVQDIRVRHLLNMTSGFRWDEMNAYLPMSEGDDMALAVLSLPLDHDPGAQFNYNSAASQLLSVIFTRVTGETMWDAAARELYAPIGIPNRRWPADPQGNSLAYSGLIMPTRDMAKFGLLYLNRGQWDGKQIIPLDYWRASTSRQSDGNQDAARAPDAPVYGFLWWVTNDAGHDAFYAAGWGGQYIYVVPDLDLLVVMTGNPQISADRFKPSRYIIRDFIVPAVSVDAGAGP
jgi:CubicO group peptidase (beta-lactamase class C family)